MVRNQAVFLGVGVAVLVVAAAAAGAFVTKGMTTPQTAPVVEKTVATNTHRVHKEQVNWNQRAPAQPVQQVRTCDDGNIVGTGIGAAAGGLAGHQFGGGKGKELATIGGVIAGGVAGHEYIPTRNTLCR